jgi:integrase
MSRSFYTGMRRESVATLQARHLDGLWGLRGVRVKGGKTRDIPLPKSVMRYLHTYLDKIVVPQVGLLTPEMPLFWSTGASAASGHTAVP